MLCLNENIYILHSSPISFPCLSFVLSKPGFHFLIFFPLSFQSMQPVLYVLHYFFFHTCFNVTQTFHSPFFLFSFFVNVFFISFYLSLFLFLYSNLYFYYYNFKKTYISFFLFFYCLHAILTSHLFIQYVFLLLHSQIFVLICFLYCHQRIAFN